MKAIVMTAVGDSGVLALQEIAEPQISHATDIKVRLYAAGVNPVDTKIRRNGLLYPNALLPAVLGFDGAGEVVAVGPNADQFKVGDKVWFCHGGLGREQGNYAEYTVLDQRWACRMPADLSYVEAAAAPLVLITAFGALFARGGLQAGQTVLVQAGAGGVGHVAVQLAKLAGARVITTVSSAEKAEFVKSLGADEAIIYSQTDVADAVSQLTSQQGADLVFDTIGGDTFKASIPLTAYYGRLVTLLEPKAVDLGEARVRNLLLGFELMLTPMLRDLPAARDRYVAILKQCAKFIDAGKLSIHVSHVLPLAQASTAHDLLEAGHTTGKVVLSI
ncbi:zinc-dependent alcohol dehydrogenase family protein [Methylovulum psychrotolerans]|uniref:Alcohol dehydrogenase n=1 Tax=Methylovulum psychrotolerans TaxID=1704499 RepID=A0A1Z4BU94_9GAMM|nr:zinc-dependent alcohol dehydrogenase family protein [Methylovulum psychrotolerans]ASF44838.1 alcohol dehydrogenase [Methylovulum psychrotolerans]POZ52075.1 alcohol dehydrogenase [Methylovulum psychrotolerans]